MENTTEWAKMEARTTSINYSISIEDRVHDLGIQLRDGISIEDLVKMDKAAGDKKGFELEAVTLNKGRLYPRSKRKPDVIETNYDYGNKVEKDERGLTPTELFSLLKDDVFEGLRGVYISSPRKEELLFLDITRLNLERYHISDLPNHANAKFYAFPTIEIPKEE